MTQKQIRQTIFAALHCSMTTVNHCIETLKQHTPDSLPITLTIKKNQ